MRTTPVRPIVSPIRARRTAGSGSARTSGEPGWPSRVPNRHAETMKRPRPAASITYSGQWSRTLLAALLEELGHHARPARLVARAEAGAVVAVEVLVEEDEVPPVGIRLEDL